MSAIDVILVPGHSASSPGAVSVTGISENAWNRPLVTELNARLNGAGVRSTILYRPPNLGYKTAMAALCNEINALAPKVAIEFHFNATAQHAATGSEALYYPTSDAGAALAELLASACARSILTKNRGAIAQARSWNAPTVASDGHAKGVGQTPQGPPLYFLQLTRCPAVIVESHFGDNAADHRAATLARDEGRLVYTLGVEIQRWLEKWG